MSHRNTLGNSSCNDNINLTEKDEVKIVTFELPKLKGTSGNVNGRRSAKTGCQVKEEEEDEEE